MSTKELIEVEMGRLNEEQLDQLYQVARELSAPEKSTSGLSLMAKLKRITINAPEDFAANVDLM